MPKLNHPLMQDNITSEDVKALTDFLSDLPRLTQSAQVKAFEQEWSQWLGVNYSVYVNSGASANLITMGCLKHLFGEGEIIVPTLTWVSDISAVLFHGLEPVFVDINPRNLCMDIDQVLGKITDRTRAVFITHVQGFNGLNDHLIDELHSRSIPLIEDVCESHGATFKGKKLGSFGLISNFSFYFAHHMSTIEGGMVSTNDPKIYNILRMMRSHGMVREAESKTLKEEYALAHPDLNPEFIFAFPAFNTRGTEIGGVLGRSQLRRLDANNQNRRIHLEAFLDNLDASRFQTDFELEGSCNYAFPLIIKNKDVEFKSRLEQKMREAGVEFRRGSSGGGNQLRQPYLKGRIPYQDLSQFPEVEHIHHFGYYIGNYPDLKTRQIRELCQLLNSV